MIVFLILITSVVAIIASWFYLLRDSKELHVAGPVPLPLIGNAHLFMVRTTSFLPLLKSLKDSYGDAIRVYLLHRRYMILYHPKYVEELVSRSDLIIKGRSYNYLEPWLGDGLLTSSGLRWRTHRKFLTPAFYFNILQNFLPVFLKNEKILLEKLKNLADGRIVDLFPIIALTALDNVTESIMGVSIHAQKDSDSDYVKSIHDLKDVAAGTHWIHEATNLALKSSNALVTGFELSLSHIISMKMRNPIIAEDSIFNLTPYRKVQENALKILHGQTKDVIERRRKELEKANITSLAQSEIGIKNKQAFLDLLLLAETEDGKKMSDDHVREEVDTFMFEGHDTTTSAICFALYVMSNHPEAQEKILDEQKDTLGDDFHRDPTYSELQRMKYLEQVIKECLRLYPAVPLIERMITKDTVIGGIQVKRNTSVIIDILHMQRNPNIFEDPLDFKPERFETHNLKNAFSWLAFSAGPRNCIGQKFAMMEMKTTLSGIIKHFNVLPTGIEPQLCADLILRSANGINVIFKSR